MSEKRLGATLFPISGLSDKPFRLRVLRVREQVPQDSQTPVRLSRWATTLWKKELKQAVVSTSRFDWPGFLTPDVETIQPGTVFTIEEDVPDRKYSVEVTDTILDIKPSTASGEERQLAAEMVKRAVSDAFGRLQRPVRDTLRQQLSAEIKGLAVLAPRISRQIEYPLGRQPSAGAGLLKAAEELVRENDGSFLPVVVLAETLRDRVYELLKRRFRSLPSQCVTEQTVRRIARDGNAVGGSRLRNLALAILIKGGIQPWVLAKPLHYDFYMGVDLLFNQVIYVFVCGIGGRHVWVRRGTPRARRGLTEKIDQLELADQLMDGVREAKRLGVEVRSLVVHRDGRWWSNEDQALSDAVAALQTEKTIGADCQVGVVEVRKSHMPVRLFTVANDTPNALEDPVPGSFLVLKESEVLLTSTGRPGTWDRQHRTAQTLLLRLARSSKEYPLDIRKVAEDAYGLTHLNWNAPEIEISLPITIRWSDERLREIVLNPGAVEDAETEPHEAMV